MATERLIIQVDEKGARVVSRNIQGIGAASARAAPQVSALRSALAFAGVGIALRSIIGTLASFGQELSTIRGITGATDAQFQQIKDTAKELGATTRFSATQAAEGITFLSRAGFSAEESMAAIGDTLFLAQAGALDLGRAADIASNVLTGFTLRADEASRVADVLALAANSSNTNVSQLGDALKFVAPVAAGAGVSLEETTAAVGALSDAGLQATLAGTGLRRIIAELLNPSTKSAKALASLGLSASEVTRTLRTEGLAAVVQDIADAGADVTTAFELFGQRGGPAFEVLLQNTDKVRELDEALINADGTARRIAETMDQNLNGALLAVRSALEAVVIEFGDLGADATLTQFFFGLADVLRAVARNVDVLAIAIATALVPALKAATLASLAFLATPIGAFLGIIAAVASAVIAIREFGSEMSILGVTFQRIGDIGQATWDLIADSAGVVIDALDDLVSFIVGDGVGAFDALIQAGKDYADFILTVIDTQLGLWIGLFDAIVATFDNLPDAFEDIFTQALNGALSLVEDAVNALAGLLNVLPGVNIGEVAFERFQNDAEGAFRRTAEVAGQAFVDGLNSSPIRSALNAIGDEIEGRANAIANERALSAREAAIVAASAGTPGGPQARSAGGVSDFEDRGGGLDGDAINDLKADYEGLVASVFGVRDAELQLADAETLLNQAVEAGIATRDEANRTLGIMRQQLADQLDPLGALNDELARERDLTFASSDERRVANQLRQIEQGLLRQGIVLTEAQAAALGMQLEAQTELNKVAREYRSILQEIEGPLDQYQSQIQALNMLLREGKVSQDQFNQAVRDARIEFLESQTDMASGAERAILKIEKEYTDGAAAIEGVITGTFSRAEDAITEFLLTGQFSFKDFAREIVADLTRVAVRLFILGPIIQALTSQFDQMGTSGSNAANQLADSFGSLSSVLGGLGNLGGLFSGLFSGGGGVGSGAITGGAGGFKFSSLPGLQGGADFEVSKANSLATLQGTDNRLVAFRAQDRERVTVSPRNGRGADARNVTISPIFQIQTPDVRGFEESEPQVAARISRLLARADRRNN